MVISLKFAFLVAVFAVPTSTSLAASRSPKLARCDGQSRRPANVHGSTLPIVDAASGTISPAGVAEGNVDIFPPVSPTIPNPRVQPRPANPPPRQIPPIGAMTPLTSFKSC
jgi:hypothetical protein